jgi:chaperonin cofactor prefoldin
MIKVTATKGTEMELDPQDFKLVDTTKSGATRIVTSDNVYYVKEDIDTINMLIEGKDPAKIKQLAEEIKHLSRKIEELNKERSAITQRLEEIKEKYYQKKRELFMILHYRSTDMEDLIGGWHLF